MFIKEAKELFEYRKKALYENCAESKKEYEKRNKKIVQKISHKLRSPLGKIKLIPLQNGLKIQFQHEQYELDIKINEAFPWEIETKYVASCTMYYLDKEIQLDSVIEEVKQFLEQLKEEVLNEKEHKIRALFQPTYFLMKEIKCQPLYLNEAERTLRALSIEGYSVDEMSKKTSYSERKIKLILGRLMVKTEFF